jgi:hypothetical protein
VAVKRTLRLCVALASLSWPLCSLALDVTHAEAQFVEDKFRLDLTVIVNAPLAQVETVLRDYARYPALDERIVEAKVLERVSDSRVLLFTKLRACSGVFCRTVNRVEQVDETSGELIAQVLPERSDMLAGTTHTVLTAEGNGTRVTYVTQLAPNFWVPSFIGRPLMLRTLREASIELFRNVERQAAQ